MTTMEIAHTDVPGWGVDLPTSRRPGVPREASPRPFPAAHWVTPEQQRPSVPVLKRADLPTLTPVFATTCPPHGISGAIRRMAYKSLDHRVRHWMLLLAADRVDAVESILERRRRVRDERRQERQERPIQRAARAKLIPVNTP